MRIFVCISGRILTSFLTSLQISNGQKQHVLVSILYVHALYADVRFSRFSHNSPRIFIVYDAHWKVFMHFLH